MTYLRICLTATLFLSMTSLLSAAEPVSFRKDIAQVLLDNCLACHGPKKAEGGYRVDTFERAIAEGDSGAAGFTEKDLEGSEAFRRIISEDADERMPLDGDPLAEDKVALLKRWIEEGAKFDGPDPKAPLASIVPPPTHPDPPETYPRTMPVTAIQFSQDGKEVYVGGYHEITVWNPTDGKLLRRVKNVGQRTLGMDLSPDGKTLAVAGGAPGKHGEVRLYDAASGELKKVFGSASDVVLDVKFSPDGKRIAIGTAESMLLVYDAEKCKKQLSITSHSDWVTAVAWSPDGSKLVSASRDKTAKLSSRLEKGELVVTYSGHGQPVKGVAVPSRR